MALPVTVLDRDLMNAARFSLHLPYCTPDIPPQAAMKSPFSRSFKSAVQGEWSDITKSMSRDFKASHNASFEEEKIKYNRCNCL